MGLTLFAMRYGIRPHDVFAAVGVAPDATDPDARIPYATGVRIWDYCIAKSGDPDFGLHMAEALKPEDALPLVTYVSRSSPTLGESYRRLSRYFALLHRHGTFGVSESGEHALLTYADAPGMPPSPRHPVENWMALMVIEGRREVGRDFAPIRVTFRHPAPPDTREHRRIFRAPLEFDADTNAVVLPRALLDLPQASANAVLHDLLRAQAEGQLKHLPAGSGVLERARVVICTLMIERAAEPGLGDVAARLGMSTRTLQRHLLTSGQTYRTLVDETRRDLGLRHLQERRLGIAEIAFHLGFSELSAFYRACKRWTGQTPGALRASVKKASA